MAFGRGARCASRRPRELNPRAHILHPGLRFELSRRLVAKRPPAPKACTDRERTVVPFSLAPISRAAGLDDFPSGHTRPAAWSRGERRRAGVVSGVGTTSRELTSRARRSGLKRL